MRVGEGRSFAACRLATVKGVEKRPTLPRPDGARFACRVRGEGAGARRREERKPEAEGTRIAGLTRCLTGRPGPVPQARGVPWKQGLLLLSRGRGPAGAGRRLSGRPRGALKEVQVHVRPRPQRSVLNVPARQPARHPTSARTPVGPPRPAPCYPRRPARPRPCRTRAGGAPASRPRRARGLRRRRTVSARRAGHVRLPAAGAVLNKSSPRLSRSRRASRWARRAGGGDASATPLKGLKGPSRGSYAGGAAAAGAGSRGRREGGNGG